jgi:hypothetical protein
MRTKPAIRDVKRLALIIVVLACAGCTPMQFTRFENPIVDENGVRVDPALVGRWAAEEDTDLSVVLDIAANGDVRIISRPENGRESPEEDRLQLVTARVGLWSIASAQIEGKNTSTWMYFRYWFPEPGVLSYAGDDTKFWRQAVRDKMIAGTIERNDKSEAGAIITATGAELRTFVLGYGSVIFKDPEDEAPRLRRLADGS